MATYDNSCRIATRNAPFCGRPLHCIPGLKRMGHFLTSFRNDDLSGKGAFSSPNVKNGLNIINLLCFIWL
nr:MAG TPA: hypothetical protein [Caudoviricetes sp.]